LKKPNNFEQAVELARKLIEPFKPNHPRIKVFIGFSVEPALHTIWGCQHARTPEEAIKMAKYEDKVAEALEKMRNKYTISLEEKRIN